MACDSVGYMFSAAPNNLNPLWENLTLIITFPDQDNPENGFKRF